MIDINNTCEFVSLSVLKNYCSMHNDNCAECKLKDFCDCMSHSPDNWSLVFEGEDEDNEIKENIEEILLKYGRREFKYNKCNYYMFYDYEDNLIRKSIVDTCQIQGVIYFDTEELLNQAIEEIGIDNIKTYIFGVESK